MLARRVYIGYKVVYVGYVHGVKSRQVIDSNTGSHATLQGYSVPHYTFSVCSTAFSQHMWGHNTLDSISVSIFDWIFWAYFWPVVATLHVMLMRLTCFFTSRQDDNYGLHLHPWVYSLFISLFRVLVLGCRLGGCRVHILYGCFSFGPSNSLFFKQ